MSVFFRLLMSQKTESTNKITCTWRFCDCKALVQDEERRLWFRSLHDPSRAIFVPFSQLQLGRGLSTTVVHTRPVTRKIYTYRGSPTRFGLPIKCTHTSKADIANFVSRMPLPRIIAEVRTLSNPKFTQL